MRTTRTSPLQTQELTQVILYILLSSETNRLGKTTNYYYNDRGSKVREDFDIYRFSYRDHGELYEVRVNGNVKVTYDYINSGTLKDLLNSVIYNNGDVINYSYDQYGQLTQTADTANGFTESYTYDANGNVLTYGNMEFEWTNGRVLSQITVNPEDPNGTADVYSYTYDESGIRSSKTVNGVTTYFTTKDGVILSQTDGTNTMYFQYDNSGNPTGFIYNGTQYFYLTNQMGDIIGITDNTGSLIATYTYGAWGEVLAVSPATENSSTQLSIANANPLRYRGYYWDAETGYYYLQSRYYNSNLARFINVDKLDISSTDKISLAGSNTYSYCSNSPINSSDKTGTISGYVLKTTYGLIEQKPYGFRIYMRLAYLSRKFCLTFGSSVVRALGGRYLYCKMTAHRIAVEIWFHAVVYYLGAALYKTRLRGYEPIRSRIVKYLRKANPIDVNWNDKRVGVFYYIWNHGGRLLQFAKVAPYPKLRYYVRYML